MKMNKFLAAAAIFVLGMTAFAKEKKKTFKATKWYSIAIAKIEFDAEIDRDFYSKTLGAKSADYPHIYQGYSVEDGFFPVYVYRRGSQKDRINYFTVQLFSISDVYLKLPGPGEFVRDEDYTYLGSFRYSLDDTLQVTKADRIDEFEEAQKWLDEQLGEHAELIRAF